MTVVKRAILKHKDGRQQEYFLFQVEEKVFRWVDAKRKPWDGVDYTSENIALKGIRVAVDTDPALVGVDLTVYPVEPPPEERAAQRIVEEVERYNDVNLEQVIREETNITEILDAAQSLTAYVFTRRDAYARALFPIQNGQMPRDLAFDGLLLSMVEALGKATKQDYQNIVRVLKEPVSNIQVAHMMPKGGTIQ